MNRYFLESLQEPLGMFELEEYIYAGAGSSCFLKLNSEAAAQKHFLIENRGGAVFIKDLRTETGTFVNDTRIVEAQLQDGDVIRVGEEEIMLHDRQHVRPTFNLKSKCHEWNRQLQQLAGVAKSNFPVLLLGPSGTGKDVIAKALHENSERKEGPMLNVNCSALSETLIESELFGHVKGSFTGAVNDRRGAFEAARNGTLFLDEIGDLPYSLQAKLLRALENAEVRPVGSDRTIKTNVRVIAATHQNLIEKIQGGTFRMDLFYRLNVICVSVPSLRQRSEDFEELLYTFAREYRVRFSHLAIQKLKKYEWPGNIRELKNLVVRCSAIFPKEQILESHVETLLAKRTEFQPYGVIQGEGNIQNSVEGPQLSVIKEIEKQMIVKRLTANHGNQKRTATDLGMPKSTLHDRLRHYNIDPNIFKSTI